MGLIFDQHFNCFLFIILTTSRNEEHQRAQHPDSLYHLSIQNSIDWLIYRVYTQCAIISFPKGAYTLNKKSIIIAVILGLILIVLPFILYFSVKVSDEAALPEPIVHTQL